MLNLNNLGRPEFSFAGPDDRIFRISSEHLLLLAKEALTISEFRLKLISEAEIHSKARVAHA